MQFTATYPYPVVLEVYSLYGEQVLRRELPEGKSTYSLDLSNCSEGVFFATVRSTNDRSVLTTTRILLAQ